MTTYTNAYEKLYTDMKTAFTVINNGTESTLGEYMMKKASASVSSNLPVASSVKDNAISAVFSYVNDKLTIKTPPVKDKTIRAFPFRASAAAMLSAVVTCGLLLTYGVAAISDNNDTSYVVDSATEEDALDTEVTR